MSQVYTILIV